MFGILNAFGFVIIDFYSIAATRTIENWFVEMKIVQPRNDQPVISNCLVTTIRTAFAYPGNWAELGAGILASFTNIETRQPDFDAV